MDDSPQTPATPDAAWVPRDLYPFESRYAHLEGARVHYLDEGRGPPLLALHGNPTWSFIYREIVEGLADRFRCVAPDYPGFGLSTAPPGYGFTPAEHARVVEALVLELDLWNLTLMVQDWGGPIGLAVATRHPERVAAVVIANTFAWPKTDAATRLFSRIMGGPIGGYLLLWRNAFVEWILPGNVRRTKLPPRVMAAYRGPFPTPGSRWPTQVFPRELIASWAFLAEVERDLATLADRPALIVWPTRDVAFRRAERRRFEQAFPIHHTVLVRGAGHYVQEDAPREIVAAVRAWRPVSPG